MVKEHRQNALPAILELENLMSAIGRGVRVGLVGLAATFALLVNSKYADAQAPTVQQAVKYCVATVHDMHAAIPIMQMFYENFDAYYNPSTGGVVNNAYTQGEMEPLFYFNKCMMKVGFPLSYKK